MPLPFIVFVAVTGLVLMAYALYQRRSARSSQQIQQRLSELQGTAEVAPDGGVLKRETESMIPILDRVLSGTRPGTWLGRLIEKSGTTATPAAIVLRSVAAASCCALLAWVLSRFWFAIPAAGALGASLPFWWLNYKASSRMHKFEEQFPESLELLSRALRAGHAFQTALHMAATEIKWPAGLEFKKVYDEQNFGLPLKEALTGMADRIPSLDVRFFVTAVLIQRETGGNLAEILDNLAQVVRERFKIQRQIRTHAAHGKFTGYVLLGLPAFLAIALSIINPDHMGLLFKERMGIQMLVGAVVLQFVGYLWIRKVIRIEV